MNTHLSEALDGVEIMKGAAQEGAETETFVTNARRVRDAFVRQGDIEARFLPTLLLGLAYAFGLIHALILFRMGLINIGGVSPTSACCACSISQPSPPPLPIPRSRSGSPAGAASSSSINSETDLDQNAAGIPPEMRGEIEFRHVSFAYPDAGILGQNPLRRSFPQSTALSSSGRWRPGLTATTWFSTTCPSA